MYIEFLFQYKFSYLVLDFNSRCKIEILSLILARWTTQGLKEKIIIEMIEILTSQVNISLMIEIELLIREHYELDFCKGTRN